MVARQVGFFNSLIDPEGEAMRRSAKLTSCLVVFLLLSAAAFITGCGSNKRRIQSPYADVEWSEYEQHKANLHTHTTESDGRLSPASAIDEYHGLGYGVLALTDHNRVTWKWEDFDRAPDGLGMIAVRGAEASDHHHLGTYFCDVPGDSSEAETLEHVREENGLAVMFHPGRYEWPAEKYVTLSGDWNEIIGMEIFNQGDRYPGDRKLWDSVLTALLPEDRPLWGLSNDDMHLMEHLGRNWNVLVVPELSTEAVRNAIESGTFFYVYAPDGHNGPSPPKINAVEVDSQRRKITVEATDYERIEWISNGITIHEGESIDLSAESDVQGYVRAVIYAPDGDALIGTQPFRIHAATE